MAGIVYEDGIARGQPQPASAEPLACDRCGTYALLTWSWDKRLCPECCARRHPALAGPVSVRSLVAESVRLLPAVGLAGVAISLAPLPLVVALRAVYPAPDTG